MYVFAMFKIFISIPKKVWLKVLRNIVPMYYARIVGVQFGKGCNFIKPNFGTEPWLIKIGDHVEITAGVHFLTHDGSVWLFWEEDPELDIYGPIEIGSNVFIGINSIILPNVRIGNNCIIGAGSVVTRDVPDNIVAAGVPARIIKTREKYFDDIQDKCFRIHSLSMKERKRILMEHYGL